MSLLGSDTDLYSETESRTDPNVTTQPSVHDESDTIDDYLEENEQSHPTSSKDTPHTQPDWLGSLKRNFDEHIIQMCSISTKNYVENNKKIEVWV